MRAGSAAGAPGQGQEESGLRVLLVDNYDSFTHNLAQLCAQLCGRLPEVVRNDALDDAALDRLVADPPDAVVLSPGPGTPDHAGDVGVCPELVRRLHATPILGVCLGHQVIAAVHGAAIVPAPEPMHGRLSRLRHDGSGLFAGLPPSPRVVRYHSLMVDAATLPPALRVTAWTEEPDGAAPVPMALGHATRPLFGVQFHPESILTEAGEALLANFLDLAASHKKSAPTAPATLRAHAPAHPVVGARPLHRDVPFVDPERAFVALYADAPAAFWLDGNERFGYLGEAGRGRIEVRGDRITTIDPGGPHGGVTQLVGDPFAHLADLMLQCSTAPDDHFPFAAGWVGWLGYELKRFCEGGDGPRGDAALPDALLLLADRTLALDHVQGRARLFALVHDGQSELAAERWLDEQALRVAALASSADPSPLAAPAPPPSCPGAALRFRLDADRDRYLDHVARIHALLAAGETYEICLTTQARTRLPAGAPPLDPLLLHRMLRRSNPAPYGAFLRFPGGAVVSASPERFVAIAPGGAVESRPIKGTRPRGATADEDARLGAELASSEKDRSENLMIVDLVRNDLGRVCAAGSVHVPALMQVEAHPAVLQLVSTVRGQLRPEVTPLEAVRALFPGGSMTGAPKIRAMRFIGELEGAPRGVYSGGIGSIGFDGGVDLAMAIRTVVIDERAGELSFGVGGAVVALSEAADEYEEALLKGRALARAVAAASGCALAPDDPFAD